MAQPDPERCAARVWQRNQHARCPNKAKPGKRLCGIHQRQADRRHDRFFAALKQRKAAP